MYRTAAQDCQTYDVIIGSKFYETVEQRPVMKEFLLTVVMEGLEEKYSILLSRGQQPCLTNQLRVVFNPLHSPTPSPPRILPHLPTSYSYISLTASYSCQLD